MEGTQLVAGILLHLILLGLQAASQELITKEVCHMETLEAECPSHHVILVHQAFYGRMEMSRCKTQSFGFDGCKADVLTELDRRCSGQQKCSFGVSTLHGRKFPGGCPSELASYLFISYSCKKVLSCDEQMCKSSDFLKVKADNGILASETTLMSGCGSPTCPWVLQTLPGQRFNLTLIDLWPRDGAEVLQTNDRAGPFCHRYATIVEEGQTEKDITSCGSEYQRESTIYISESSRIRIKLYSPMIENINMHFLIRFQAVHCPDIESPANAKVSRNGDSITVSCLKSDREWHLVCQGTAWVGEIGMCNDTVASHVGNSGRTSKGSPFGMLIVIGLGVALGVLIGIMLLVVVFLFMKRHRRREQLRRQRNLLRDGSPGRDTIVCKQSPYGHQQQITKLPGGPVRYTPDHSFTATIQLKRPVPLPLEERHDFPLLAPNDRTDDLEMGCKVIGCTGYDTNRSHVYETTRGNSGIIAIPNWKQEHRPGSDSVAKTILDGCDSETRNKPI